MNWRVFISKLERHLNKKYPHIEMDFHVSRRRRYVHKGFEKALLSYSEYKKILDDIENFRLQNKDKELEFVKPPILVKTVKWKFDYILFRKSYGSV